ncbi:recombinase family protein [Halolamina salifodinae]|uniref:DNA invertase Pin-like site-specific DNA recombinase n=1 Tax=Halolamina salifodinae TaxID=1202767 RepID=A0A8T4GW60_9EURY|nr:recombinase family protein [Halolamina salifodinae]MBP1987227.1 DNA invertase Pin-like site-specific DNA recombinase [Halolamina salifodinae]
MAQVGLYARVSTEEQDVERQINEAREYATNEFDDPDIRLYPDVISGVDEGRGEEYERLWNDIDAGDLDLVVVHELSRVSRLGAGAIHELLEHSLANDTSVKDLEVGLEVNLDDSPVTNAVKQMIAGLMGDLARVEHKQKLRRINSGIRAAQDAGKWTGRPPKGFRVDDNGVLRVEPAEFLATRRALERIGSGEPISEVSDDTGIANSTLRHLRDDRRDLYFYGEADDDRVDEALDEVRPLSDPDVDDAGDLEARVDQLEALLQGNMGRPGADEEEPENGCPNCERESFASREEWEAHIIACEG